MYEIGTILSTRETGYRHKMLSLGGNLVAHASKKKGRVVIEPLSEAAPGRQLDVQTKISALNDHEILARAHSAVGKKYHLLHSNCEHFVTSASGLKPTSAQVQQGCLLVGAGFLLWRLLAN